jgi:Protein of unknown function (DUF1073)
MMNSGSSTLGTSFMSILRHEDIEPGSDPSYQVCKLIYVYHPLGQKMAEAPIGMAQCMPRDIVVSSGPEERLVKAFKDEWHRLKADDLIFNLMSQSRIYGVATLAVLTEDEETAAPLNIKRLHELPLSFNVYDPLNTAGSLTLNQNPASLDFQHVVSVVVQGKEFHRSRYCVMMNERPIFLQYSQSAYGYVGRSCYQRALFPLKSFIQTLLTDDMVTRKAGVLIAKMKMSSSILDGVMQRFAGMKRQLLKEARTDNVLSIDVDEAVETLNMQNLDGAYGQVRRNILENIAAADDMPAQILNSETFAEGFGEGTEDAKRVARYVERFRAKMQPAYDFMDEIVRRRAWNPVFYAAIQNEFEEYKDVPYETAYQDWCDAFQATWPSLLIEPESERIKTDEVKLRAVITLVQVLMPALDPPNRARIIQWAQDNFNELKLIFKSPLELDIEALIQHAEEQAEKAETASDKFEEKAEEGPEEPSAPSATIADSAPARVMLSERFLKAVRDPTLNRSIRK